MTKQNNQENKQETKTEDKQKSEEQARTEERDKQEREMNVEKEKNNDMPSSKKDSTEGNDNWIAVKASTKAKPRKENEKKISKPSK